MTMPDLYFTLSTLIQSACGILYQHSDHEWMGTRPSRAASAGERTASTSAQLLPGRGPRGDFCEWD